jgi:tetratricopeptide (TPR) repeat protein
MVSRFYLSAVVLAAFVAISYAGQLPEPASQAFRAASANGQHMSAPAPSAGTLINPEMRGDIYMARKMFREAAEVYGQGPQDSAVLLNKTGIAYHQMLELDAAKKFYERALKLNPAYPEAINNLGTIYYSRKSYRRAVNLYKKALRYSPNSASIYSNLGTGYFARRDYKDASEAFQTALRLDPEVFEHHNTQGVLLQERSVEERAKFHFYLAKTYARVGKNDQALIYIRKALEEGFKERKRFQEDPEFAGLKALPEFQQLLAMEPRVL